ncbi:MAG TPA: hypothetical protein VGO00_02745 [Kofleriaceae bacterium]|nr:hypothetical protein [Kofleriaceae bacterium]
MSLPPDLPKARELADLRAHYENLLRVLREAVLNDRRIAEGGALALDTDDESFDPEFAKHPLSRVRRALHHVTKTARVDDPIKALPAFTQSGGNG